MNKQTTTNRILDGIATTIFYAFCIACGLFALGLAVLS